MYELSAVQKSELESLSQELPVNGVTKDRLTSVRLVGVTGPSTVGKTTTIRGSGLYKVPGFTTRPVRKGHEAIRTIAHTKRNVDSIIEKGREGALVQLILGPQGYLYGSEPRDYRRNTTNVVDMHASSILNLFELPFRSTEGVLLVAPVEDWVESYEERDGSLEDPKNQDRLWWDVSGLALAMQNLDVFTPIVNARPSPASATKELIKVANGEALGDSIEQQQAYDSAKHLLRILSASIR